MAKFKTSKKVVTRVTPDGVILDTVETEYKEKVVAEPFFMVFTDMVIPLYESRTILNATTKVLFKLLEFAEWNTGKAYINAARAKEIMESCRIGKTSYHEALKNLAEAHLIEKEGTTYTILPAAFWKGERKVRNEIVGQMPVITYSNTGVMTIEENLPTKKEEEEKQKPLAPSR